MTRELGKIVSSLTLKCPSPQSRVDQHKMRRKRNQACSSYSMEKLVRQKEQQRGLKAELHDNVLGMRSAVHAHFLFLPKLKDKNFSSSLAPPSTEVPEIVIQDAGHLCYVSKYILNEP
ncbi:hypothetical protein O181_019716 [Austropuccinia psidii MF-1]|uniref:Uncharacterized protein n=1 Tax=Austropuccinia psidii MF-1 TaxID=1389203 RepID=A0A9Q3C7P9_9BASI|nr:hypothetical protein [Austropuccinia psidii MF-1]